MARRPWRATIDGQHARYYASEEARRRHAERWADQLQQPVVLHNLTAEGTWAASGTIEPQRTFHDQAGFRIHPWNNPTGRYVVPPETPVPDRAPADLIHLAHHLFAARAYAFEPIHRTDGQWILASEDDIPDVVTVITVTTSGMSSSLARIHCPSVRWIGSNAYARAANRWCARWIRSAGARSGTGVSGGTTYRPVGLFQG